jgi:hypothetical protein
MDITRVYQGNNKIKVITNKDMLEQGKLKITFETDNVKHLAVMSDSVGLEEIYNAVNAMLIGMTFHQITIDNYILELAESIETK